jgi:hypothetical protein
VFPFAKIIAAIGAPSRPFHLAAPITILFDRLIFCDPSQHHFIPLSLSFWGIYIIYDSKVSELWCSCGYGFAARVGIAFELRTKGALLQGWTGLWIVSERDIYARDCCLSSPAGQQLKPTSWWESAANKLIVRDCAAVIRLFPHRCVVTQPLPFDSFRLHILFHSNHGDHER